MEIMERKPVFIVSSNSCHYCTKAKNLLKAENVEVEELNFDDYSESDRTELGHCIYGAMPRRFVPFLFVNKTPLGSYSELEKAKEDGLLKTLATKQGDGIL
mmetsp:Transcript_2922/g.3434  ORF Transcript_2922/g.3434 Transcript_2922/m.3434 type:complete len:101 (+) Transcript_2922:1-303(+)